MTQLSGFGFIYQRQDGGIDASGIASSWPVSVQKETRTVEEVFQRLFERIRFLVCANFELTATKPRYLWLFSSKIDKRGNGQLEKHSKVPFNPFLDRAEQSDRHHMALLFRSRKRRRRETAGDSPMGLYDLVTTCLRPVLRRTLESQRLGLSSSETKRGER
jgi:hypothetical protein